MTLARLIDVVKLYLQTDFPAVENHPLLAQGSSVDFNDAVNSLIITAANSARKWAEMRHDFRCASVDLTVTIPGEGEVSLADVNGVNVKTISHCYLSDRTTAVSMITNKADWFRRYERQELYPRGYAQQTPDVNKYYEEPALLYINDTLKTSGTYTDDTTINLHGYRWLPDYALQNSSPALVSCPGNTLILNLQGIDEWPANLTNVEIKSDLYKADFTKQLSAGVYSVDNQNSGTILVFDVTFLDPSFEQVVQVFYNSTGTTSTDWFLKHGFEYMQWATIVEVNHLLQTFVPRQEGSLSPPEKLRDRAFEALRELDAWISEGGVYHEL